MKAKQIISLLVGITCVALSPAIHAAGNDGGGGGGFHVIGGGGNSRVAAFVVAP